MESPIAKSYTVHMKRRTLVWFYMLSMQTKRSVKVESEVGSLLNRLIQMFWFYASITFLQCNIHRNYGFIRVLSQTPRMGVFIPVHSICSVLNPVLCNILPAAHAITGCDLTSSLFGIGKRTVFSKYLKTAQKTLEICPSFQTVTLMILLMPPGHLFVDCTTKKENWRKITSTLTN